MTKAIVYISGATGADKVYTTPLQAGEGVGKLAAIIPKDVLTRIEALKVLNDRRTRYRCRRMKGAMIRLAREYKRKGLVAMAQEVRKEADDL